MLSQTEELSRLLNEYSKIEKELAEAAAEAARAKARATFRDSGDSDEGEAKKVVDRLIKEAGEKAKAKKLEQLQTIRAGLLDEFKPAVSNAFREQCFIQRYTYELIKNRIEYLDEETKLPYEEGKDEGISIFGDSGQNHPIVVQGRPFGFINQLVTPKSTARLFELSPAVLSQLQPYIRLYKVDENNLETPIRFDSSSRKLATALMSSKKRGSGVGLKSFNFAYEGSDPFSVKKSITAKLEIFSATFGELLEPRTSTIKFEGQKKPITTTYSYTDLALKTGGTLLTQKIKSGANDTGRIDNLNKLKFRLKAVVGYSMPSNLHIPAEDSYGIAEVKQAIYNSFVTLNLTPTIHEFKFDDSGRVNFTINYLAYVEDFFDMAYFNIFSDIRTTSKVYKRKILRKWYESTCDNANIDKLKKGDETAKQHVQRNAFRSLLEKLIAREKVFVLEMPYDNLTTFITDPLVNSANLLKKANGIEAEKTKSEVKAITTGDPKDKDKKIGIGVSKDIDPNTHEQITFFYLYDLIDIAMNNIEEALGESGYIEVLNTLSGPSKDFIEKEKQILIKMRENFKQLRVVLGPIEIRDPANSSAYMDASIADIPISLKYFAEWMTEKVIARDRVEYNLSRFINDLIKNYLRTFLNDSTCYGSESVQKVVPMSSTITSYKDVGEQSDEFTTRIVKDRKSFGPDTLGRLNMQDESGLTVFNDCLLNVMGKRNLPNTQRPFQEQINYMVFYAGRTSPKDSGVNMGIKTNDENAGIFHYILGRNNGIIKNIQLRRTDSPGLKELRFEQEGFDGLLQLREVYDVDISTFSYPNALPGTYIFVDPRGFDPNSKSLQSTRLRDLTELGIGGYFMIIRSEHVFREGEASTKITAKWVSELYAGEDSDPNKRKDPDAKLTNSKSGVPKCKTRMQREKTSVIPSKKGSEGGKDTVSTPS